MIYFNVNAAHLWRSRVPLNKILRAGVYRAGVYRAGVYRAGVYRAGALFFRFLGDLRGGAVVSLLTPTSSDRLHYQSSLPGGGQRVNEA